MEGVGLTQRGIGAGYVLPVFYLLYPGGEWGRTKEGTLRLRKAPLKASPPSKDTGGPASLVTKEPPATSYFPTWGSESVPVNQEVGRPGKISELRLPGLAPHPSCSPALWSLLIPKPFVTSLPSLTTCCSPQSPLCVVLQLSGSQA